MNKVVMWSLIGLNVLVISTVGYILASKPKVAYVDLSKVYSEFEMKKELEAKLQNVENSRKTILDSIELKLNGLSNIIKRMDVKDKDRDAKIQDFELSRQDYLLKQKNFSENNDAAATKYDQEIWKQINQYVKEYGKEHEYAYILGADGTGAVMYADEAKDLTKEVSTYVNERYKGEKK